MSFCCRAAQLLSRFPLDKNGHEVSDRPVRELLVSSRNDLAHPILCYIGEPANQSLDHFLERPRFVSRLAGVHRRILPAFTRGL